ncbi:hypothetical protein [Phytopseudomonas seleniipraecipitans]|uniref:hypothetical protein n=1 Tax=Phytopseudomonas seleniipraecipitans TaxID=640205 RepID=UPI003B836636
MDDGIEINRKAGEQHQADQAELYSPAQQGVHATGAAFGTGAGRSGTSHGAALYALCKRPADVASGLQRCRETP